jgi:hypothetical protein
VSAVQIKISDPIEILFKPTRIGGMDLRNRIVMAPMTRAMSPGGVPGENVARYYRRRAEGGVGLIITEGTFIPHPSAGHDDNAPRIYGDDALSGWRRVVEQVHEGKPTITVGSITLDNSVAEMMRGEGSLPENNLALLLEGLERGDFDLVAVGKR